MTISTLGGETFTDVSAGEITAGTSSDENRSFSVDDIVDIIVIHAPGGGGDFAIASRSNDSDETLTTALANTFTQSDVAAVTVTKTLPVGSAAIDGKTYGFQIEAVAGGQLDIVAQGTDRIVSGGGLVTTYSMTALYDFVVLIYEHQNARFNIFSSSAAGGAVTSISSVPQDRLVGRISTGTGASENLTAAQVRTILAISAFGATLIDDATAGDALTTLGVTAFIQTLLDDADAATARSTLGIAAAIASALAAGPTIVDGEFNGQQTADEGTITGVDIDCSTGVFFEHTVAGSVTFTLSNIPSSTWYVMNLRILYTSGSVTWTGFTGLEWVGGVSPSFTVGNEYDIVFSTKNGGTNWRAKFDEGYS